MIPVIVESPYAGNVTVHEAYARACMRDCLTKGEAPYASHLLYTQPGVLRDDVPAEREHGIQAGFVWRSLAHHTAVYTDFGITPGMLAGIRHAEGLGHPIVYREIGKGCVGGVREAQTVHRFHDRRVRAELASLRSNGFRGVRGDVIQRATYGHFSIALARYVVDGTPQAFLEVVEAGATENRTTIRPLADHTARPKSPVASAARARLVRTAAERAFQDWVDRHLPGRSSPEGA